MHLPTVNVRFTREDLNGEPDKSKWKMRIKRTLVFAVILAVLGSVYYFSSLHFKPDAVSEDVWKAQPENKRIVINTRPKSKTRPSTNSQLFRHQDHSTPSPELEQFNDFDDFDDNHSEFSDFDDGEHVQSVQSTQDMTGWTKRNDRDKIWSSLKPPSAGHSLETAGDERTSSTRDSLHAEGEVGGERNSELEQRLEEQQRLIEQQAQILKQLQDKLFENDHDVDQRQRTPQQEQQTVQLPAQILTTLPKSSTEAVTSIFKKFRGQIKGHFHGMIIDNTNIAEGVDVESHPEETNHQPLYQSVKTSPVQAKPQEENVADNFGVRTPVSVRKAKTANSAHGTQKEELSQDTQIADAAKMFLDARHKGSGPIPASASGRQSIMIHTDKISNEAVRGTTDSQTGIMDAETLFEQARQKGMKINNGKIKHENVLASQQRASAGLRATDRGRNDVQDERSQTGDERESTEQSDREQERSSGLISGKEVEKAIEKVGDDLLLKERFNMVKDELESLPAGHEPEVEMGGDKNLENTYREKEHMASPIVKVHVYNLTQTPSGSFHCVPLRLSVMSRTICVHSHGTDSEQSEHLIISGKWEERELGLLMQALKVDSSLGLVDLGAGLGVYTVAALAEGRHVLAVEPLKENARLFHKTMQLNRGTDRVTLVTDALGEQTGIGRLLYPHPVGNMGAVYVKPLKLTEVTSYVTDLVKIVRLDDLLPLTVFSRAVMKLDVQGDENLVLRGAGTFFKRVDVRYVFMHWLPTQNPTVFREVGALLKQWGYEAAENPTGRVLSGSDLTNDLNFVVWRKAPDTSQSQGV